MEIEARRTKAKNDSASLSYLIATLAVFDAKTVADRGTYVDPIQYPDGIVHVLVNGAFAVEGGNPTGRLHGNVIRRGRQA